MDFLTPEQIKARSTTLKGALDVSIEKWQQVYDATPEELKLKGNAILFGTYCGVCQYERIRTGSYGCSKCILYNSEDGDCCREWQDIQDRWGDWPKFKKAVRILIDRLKRERDKIMKTHKIQGLGGREVSDETATKALTEYFKTTEEKPYQFKAGDVCQSRYGFRIIVSKPSGELMSVTERGIYAVSEEEDSFRRGGYRKIGELKDFIKE